MDTQFLLQQVDYRPAYLDLFESGELAERAKQAIAALEDCRICPRDCGVNRLQEEIGTCGTGRYAWVASYFPHYGEEDPLRGDHGSGTIFFTGCGLRCVFCQNYDISQQPSGDEVSPEYLAAMMIQLQMEGCHNINLVTPEHVVPQILEALVLAVDGGLHIPLVYNSCAYDTMETLHLMDGVIDIYMPDFKIWEPALAKKYLLAEDYPEVARATIREMHRQVGPLQMDEQGIAKRGVLLRHLIMPGNAAGTTEIMQFIANEISVDTYVNLMAQYRPSGKVPQEKYKQRYEEINRSITMGEYARAQDAARHAGLWRFEA